MIIIFLKEIKINNVLIKHTSIPCRQTNYKKKILTINFGGFIISSNILMGQNSHIIYNYLYAHSCYSSIILGIRVVRVKKTYYKVAHKENKWKTNIIKSKRGIHYISANFSHHSFILLVHIFFYLPLTTSPPHA